MKIVKLSNLSNKEREEYERQKIEREERYISSQKKSVPNVITGPTANNNILPKANNWKLATPKETKGAVELTDLATKDYKDNFTQYILDKARLGVQSFGSGIVNLYTTDIQKNNDNALKLSNLVNDKEYNQKIKEKIEEQNKNMIDLSNKISTNDEHSMSIAEQDLPEWQKITGNVVGVVANQLPSIGLNLVAPGTGLSAMGLSAAGNSMNEEINRGTDPKKAQLTGILKGGIEVATEKITGGNIIAKKGSLDNIVGKTIANKVKSKVAQKVLSKGYEIGGEILEEQISDNAGYVIDKLVNNREMPGFEEWYNNAGETTKITFLSTVLMNALGLGGNTHNNVQQNAETQKWINEAEKITQKENSVQNTAQNTAQIANKPIQRQITQPQIKMPQNGNMRQLNILPVANEQNKYTNRIFNESAKKYNIDITDQSMQTINRVLSERNIQGQFNADLFKDDSQSALWKTSKDANGNTIREVIFNPKASTEKRIQNLSIHELWHDMEGTEISNKLRKLVLDYDSTRSGYEEARQALTETYSQVYDPNSANFNSLIENEAVADILGQKLGDQEFVSNLTRQDRTVGQRLYSEIKYLWNQFRGYKNQNQFVEDLYYKWTQAYKNNNSKMDVGRHINEQSNSNESSFSMQNNQTWQQYLDKNFKPTGTRTSMQDILPTAKTQNNTQNVAPTAENNVLPKAKRKLNPTEIANLTMNDANTTPILPQKNYTKGNKQSSFFRNVIEDAQFLNKDLRQEMSQDENIRYYKGITNAETLEKAYTDLQNGGQNETMKWFNKENKDISAENIAKGWILLKQYQDSGDYQGLVEVAKKMRNMGTKAGQAVQAYNILSRLTPEGMFYYAQSELSEAYNKMAEGKSKEWIDDNRSKFDLTPEETQIIKEKMESIQGIEDERTKKIALAEIQKIITDKIPPTASQSIKSWMRISMLFNPKTQLRNIAGNAVILPANMTSDFIASGVDKIISKKTGVRTTGNTNLKNYAKGFGKGLYESYDDFRKGINTRNIEDNKFEVTEGKNFKDKGIGKVLNRVDNMLSFMLDAGDRGFYEATFTNSINNQLVLNNTTKVTPDMIDIATQEALQRTWQDNNAYTNTVLKIRKLLNFNKGYGLGDILIPFAKTPANLTKAIVDYSPVGLTKTLAVDARKLNNSLQNGQYTPQLQYKFVQDLGKGMAGTLLYVLGCALAKAGVITGEADEDKDVKNFMKNSLGINSYSIKIGDKSFAYDWAQPVATPFAIMANFEKYNRENPDASVIDKAINSINIGSEQLLQQSFMESINTVLNGNGTTLENISQAILKLPSMAVPTLSKQIADMIDGTQRTSFEYDKPIDSAINSVKAKIPVLSKTLPASVDTLGNEIQKYGGDNGVWNVMFNPANMNKGKLSKAGEEIYNQYLQTGDKTIFPRTAPYYINNKGEKINMTADERSDFQKITGKYVEKTINGLLNNKDYKKLSNDKKAELINEIVSDSYSKAKYDILNIDSKQYEKLRNTLKSVSTTSYYNYKSKTEEVKKDSERLQVLVDANYSNKEKQGIYEQYILSDTDKKYSIIKNTNININQYLKYKVQESKEAFSSDKKDDGTVKGKTIVNSAKNKRYEYIMNMPITHTQKLVLWALEYEPSNNSEKKQLINYVETLPNKTKKEQLDILSNFKGVTIYKDGTFDY